MTRNKTASDSRIKPDDISTVSQSATLSSAEAGPDRSSYGKQISCENTRIFKEPVSVICCIFVVGGMLIIYAGCGTCHTYQARKPYKPGPDNNQKRTNKAQAKKNDKQGTGKKELTEVRVCVINIRQLAKGHSSMVEQRSPKPSMRVRLFLPLLNLYTKKRL